MDEGRITPDIDNILEVNRFTILDGIFGCRSPEQVESSMAFARYLNKVGLTRQNYRLFLQLIETNNKWIIDDLIGKRDPRLLFSAIKPTEFLVERALTLLSLWHPGQIYSKVLLSVLGIIECNYFKSDEGYRIHKLEISDLNNIGKFLDPRKDQFDMINTSLLEILDHIARMGEYDQTLMKNVLSNHAFNIRMAYFDNDKSLMDVIPKVLLIRLSREDREISPSPEYVAYRQTLSNN